MKILALADAAYIHTQKWARYFTSRRHKLEIISFRHSELEYAQVHYIDTGVSRPEGGNWHYLLGLPAVRQRISQVAPDLLFCQFLTSYGLIGALLKSSLPLVIRLQGADIQVTPDRSLLHRLTAGYALNRSDLIIMAGSHMRDRVEQLVGVGKCIMSMPLGIDLQLFNQVKTSERREFSCITNRLLKKHNNVDLILEAISLVRNIQPSVHLTIAGHGPLRPYLEGMVHRLDLKPWVTFLGEIANEAMPDLLRGHSLYLSAKNTDGTSNSLLEAMACGTFPLVSDNPANWPWISDGNNGFLVPIDEPESLALRILEAFGASQLRTQARRINFEIVKSRGDLLLNMEQCETAMEQLLLGARTDGSANRRG